MNRFKLVAKLLFFVHSITISAKQKAFLFGDTKDSALASEAPILLEN